MTTLYTKLKDLLKKKGAGFFVLLDPDKQPVEDIVSMAETCQANGVDGLLMGGSLLFSAVLDDMVKAIKQKVSIPVILFPGNGGQLSKHADAVLFLSLISGRNPHYLIGEQVLAAPLVRAMGLEPISTGYMLVESGGSTSVEFMSHTMPLPRSKPDIAVAHALAGEYLGMKLIYLEAGSGARLSVPEELITSVRQAITIPLIVGGGIQTPEEARSKVMAGASFVVTGDIIERKGNEGLIKEFSEAIHSTKKPKESS